MNNNMNQVSVQALEQAFAIFNQVSAELTDAYQQLQLQVSCLNAELAAANGELHRQLQEKDTLSERLARLLETLPGGVIVLDRQGRVIDANPAAHGLLGPDLAGQQWTQITTARLRPTQVSQEYELIRGHTGPRQRRISISSSPFVAGEQILLLHDVTQANALQQELERHRRLSAMGEMAASLAHQLRTPLSTALLYTAHLGKATLSADERKRFSERAMARMQHLEMLIQDMMQFVKGQAAPRSRISIDELLAAVVQTVQPQLERQQHQLEVTNHAAGAVLDGERDALIGAVLGLVENAMQATPAGGWIRLRAETEADTLALIVEDYGKGIAPEIQERLFEPFFTTRTDGTGLGLAIVRRVVQSHAGSIAVDSTPGCGSRFAVRLPMALPA